MSTIAVASSSAIYDKPQLSVDISLKFETWYHGMITRIQAQSLVTCEGDFLVRNSISLIGDYVLTVFWKYRPIHFQINKILSATSSTSYLFQFEDEQFESISDLILFYQTHQKYITSNSGCIISNPVPNSARRRASNEYCNEIEKNYMKLLKPLQYHNNRRTMERSLSQKVLLNEAHKRLTQSTTSLRPIYSQSVIENNGKKLLLHDRTLPIPHKRPIEEEKDDYCEMDYNAMEESSEEILDASTGYLCSQSSHCKSLLSLNGIKVKCGSYVNGLTQSCHNIHQPYCKFSRADSAPSLPMRITLVSKGENCLTANTLDYDLPLSSAIVSNGSQLDLNTCNSILHNKNEIQSSAGHFLKFRRLLLCTSAERCAYLINYEDCRLLRFIPSKQPYSTCEMRIDARIALILLPQGQNIRIRLNERWHSLYIILILLLIKAGASYSRKVLIEKLNEIAQYLLHKHGNLFSFMTIIDALKFVLDYSQCSHDLQMNVQCIRSDLCTAAKNTLELGTPSNESNKVVIPFIQPLLDLFASTPTFKFLETSSISSQVDSLWKWLDLGRTWLNMPNDDMRLARIQCTETVESVQNFFASEFTLECLFEWIMWNNVENRVEKLSQIVRDLQRSSLTCQSKCNSHVDLINELFRLNLKD